jgi:beta-glucuronidase
MCDRMGILVWEESLGWGNREVCLTDPDFQAKQIRETRKMAIASINHPSIILRGFLNEAVTYVETAKPLVKELAKVLHEVDPTTLVTFATDKAQRDVCLEYVDVISFNTYPCWYSGNEDQFMNYKELDRVLSGLAEFASKEEFKDKPVLISEVGAEALPNLHGGQRWSEEYQADLHEAVVKYVAEHERYSGVLIWQFCDTRTFIGSPGQTKAGNFNFKGALDCHRVPKEAWRRVGKYLESSK